VSPMRAVSVVLLTAALGCAGFAFLAPDDARSATPGAELGTPLWSPRRVPQPIVDAVGAQRLQSDLDQSLGDTNACFVVDLGGAPLATRAADVPFIPASTEKILTGVVALSVLGPDARLETRALAPKAPENGALERLYLVGGGDPLLATPAFQQAFEEDAVTRGNATTPLTALADAIVATGVRRIPGGIVADDSRYDTLRFLPTWKETYRTDGQVGPIGALTVDRGFSVLRPRPISVEDPALYAAQQLQGMLSARGVTVGAAPTRGTAPTGSVEVATLQSPPIRDVVAEVLRVSDNLGAEMLVREIGFRLAQQGSTEAGTKAVAERLAALGVPTAGLTLVDGSGLDRGNRVTCQTLVAALELGARPELAALWAGLAVSGQSGRLVNEFKGTPLEGKVRAKTGSLDGVTGLVGIVDVGRPVRFAFVANAAFTEGAGINLRNRVASVIARFPDAPPADVLVPAPVAVPAS
jgi:D-alanyl-D-alanine carboxypeptidase/D-alanyl-D-alanine-endopeptidase (penicillin-binding protein 4)